MTGVKGKSGRKKSKGETLSKMIYTRIYPSMYEKFSAVADGKTISDNLREVIRLFVESKEMAKWK